MTSIATRAAPETGPGNRPLAPGPKGIPMLGSLPEIKNKGLIRFYVDNWRQYGDIVRLQTGPIVQHLLARPDDIKYVLSDNKQNYEKGLGFKKLQMTLGTGLFTAEGALWKRQRNIMQPMFTPRSITQFAGDMTGATESMLQDWQAHGTGGKVFNVNTQMMRLAMNIIGRTMFNIDIGKDAMQAAKAFTFVLENVSQRSLSPVDIPLFIPTKSNRHFNQSIKTLDDFIYGIIDERARNPREERDLLSTLMNARDPETGEPMSRRQLRDEVITIFFAGHETTAQALTWTWFLLAQHPDVEEKLYEEVDRVLGGRTPAVADLEQMPYTEMVVQESMRLYPPVWVYVRDSIDEDEIGGYYIPPHSMIVLSQYITHRHPDYWEEPEKFDPERFTPERSEGRPRYAYFPFGGGPRICLGNNFAMLEAATVVAMIAQRFRLRLVPGQHIEPRMVGTLRPSGPVRMRLQPR